MGVRAQLAQPRTTLPAAASICATTPSGAPILGASGVPGLWLNVGHGALGFTFSFATANIVAELVSGRPSPLPLDGLSL